jgi:hypothetical protein
MKKCRMGRVRKYRTRRMPKQKLRRESLLRILVFQKILRASDTADLRHPGERGLVPGEAGGGQDGLAGDVLGRQRRVGPGGQPGRWYEHCTVASYYLNVAIGAKTSGKGFFFVFLKNR